MGGCCAVCRKNSRYIKREDILYEIKKIQQEQILQEGYVYEYIRRGMPKEKVKVLRASGQMEQQLNRLKFAKEKLSVENVKIESIMVRKFC